MSIAYYVITYTNGEYELQSRGGGDGVLGLEKGTDCGPSAAELWLSRANNAKKGGLSSHYK